MYCLYLYEDVIIVDKFVFTIIMSSMSIIEILNPLHAGEHASVKVAFYFKEEGETGRECTLFPL